MTVRELLKDGIERLEAAGIENAAYDARQLLCKAYGKSSAQLLAEMNRPLCAGADGGTEPANIEYCPGDCGARISFDADILRRAKHVPLQHILGKAEFMGLEFEVNEHVLIPRQDTETLVETVLEREKDREIKVLDMCTGSGCIAVALKKLGGYRQVEASDLMEDALSTAAANADANKADIIFHHSDLFEKIDGKFDVIVSNPPYIRTAVIDTLEPEVRDHDPVTALDGGEDGLFFYREIVKQAAGHMEPEGRIYFEIGYDQAEELKDLLKSCGFINIEVIKDLTGLDRVVLGRLS